MQTVQGIYGAFGQGDVPAILDALADDVVWEPDTVDHGIPWIVPGTGKDTVAAFFKAAGEGLEFQSFEPVAFLEGGDQVAAVIKVQARANATGKSIRDTEIHLWSFDAEGKVTSLRHFIDTHQHVQAITTG